MMSCCLYHIGGVLVDWSDCTVSASESFLCIFVLSLASGNGHPSLENVHALTVSPIK